jgi:invasion protein IalB
MRKQLLEAFLMTISALLALALALADPAATQAPASTPAKVEKTADQDQMICKSQVQTGTRFSTRICRTKAQWEEQTREAREYVDRQTTGCNRGPSC